MSALWCVKAAPVAPAAIEPVARSAHPCSLTGLFTETTKSTGTYAREFRARPLLGLNFFSKVHI